MRSSRRAKGASLAAVLFAACGGGPGALPYEKLSQYGFFVGAMAEHRPAANVIPYDVASELYADGTHKLRFLVIPAGKRIGFRAQEKWAYPEGTILVKTFYVDRDARDPRAGRRLLETRLLIYRGGEWTAHTYLWNDAQTEAERYIPGKTLEVPRTGASGQAEVFTYRVPNVSQCDNCHAQAHTLETLGPRTRQLNRTYDHGQGPVNQIQHLASLGLFDGPVGDPATLDRLSDPRGSDPIERRARSYLDVNCGHCHNAKGAASSTGLRLNWEASSLSEIGVCRAPVATGPGSGGLFYDIVPGEPDQSIMVLRMASTDPGIKMPEIPTLTSDAAGVALIRAWIAQMTPAGCGR